MLRETKQGNHKEKTEHRVSTWDKSQYPEHFHERPKPGAPSFERQLSQYHMIFDLSQIFYVRRIKDDPWPIHDFKGVSVRFRDPVKLRGRPERLERTGLGRRLSTSKDTWLIGFCWAGA